MSLIGPGPQHNIIGSPFSILHSPFSNLLSQCTKVFERWWRTLKLINVQWWRTLKIETDASKG